MTRTPHPRSIAAHDAGRAVPEGRAIGRVGTIARLALGLVFLVAAATLGEPSMWHWIVGLVVLPIVSIAVMTLLRPDGAPPVRWTGPTGHLVNVTIGLLIAVPMPHAALIFYGTAMLLAAARGYAGCELLAFSNHLLGRDDEIGCPVFSHVDAVERRVGGQPR